MDQSEQDRLARLEHAALCTDGALYAIHDLIAHWLALAPDAQVHQIFAKLNSDADNLDAALGEERIAGYRDELASIEREVHHARFDLSGISQILSE